MGHSDLDPAVHERRPWNAGQNVGPKRPFTPRDIWAIRFYLDLSFTIATTNVRYWRKLPMDALNRPISLAAQIWSRPSRPPPKAVIPSCKDVAAIMGDAAAHVGEADDAVLGA